MTRFSHVRSTICALSAVLCASLPLPVLAAPSTPQTDMNKAMASLGGAPILVNGEFTIKTSLKPVKKSGASATISTRWRIPHQLTSQIGTDPSQALRLSLSSFNFEGAAQGVTQQAALGNGLTIESKTENNVIYIRILEATPEAAAALRAARYPVDALMGQWIAFPAGAAGMVTGSPLFNMGETLVPPLALIGSTSEAANLFKVKRVEKTWTDSSGHIMMRARMAMNASALSAAEWMETTDAADVAQRKAIAKRYTDLRAKLRSTEFVAEVDRTDGVLTRFEMGGILNQKNGTGTVQVRWNGGVTLKRQSQTAIADSARNVTAATQ